ncbi:hypothetical protein CI238_00428 [Colletotrichum incanum]|uniref:Uncharacterized protein n=1 Tax=Colletotrichum incanum TaxID=1573173 RepID=A0A161WB84_COLIC|nr:hypothetical protein CI238_00428 [Colletotrichum incanum]
MYTSCVKNGSDNLVCFTRGLIDKVDVCNWASEGSCRSLIAEESCCQCPTSNSIFLMGPLDSVCAVFWEDTILDDSSPYASGITTDLGKLMISFSVYETCQSDHSSRSREVPGNNQGNDASPQSRKRGTQNDESTDQEQNCDGSGDSKGQKRRKQDTNNGKNEGGLSLACPFYKKDGRKHHKCLQLQLSRIRDVKQHLSRIYIQPHFYPSCAVIFRALKDQREHIRPRTCDNGNFQPPDGITQDQQKDLSARVNRKLQERDQWFAVWDIVFPGKPRPESPYVYGPFHEVATSFLKFWQEKGRQIYLNHLRSDSALLPRSGSDEARSLARQNTFINIIINQFIETSVPKQTLSGGTVSYTPLAPGEQQPLQSHDSLFRHQPGLDPLIREIGVDANSFDANEQDLTDASERNVDWTCPNTNPSWYEMLLFGQMNQGGSSLI